MGSCFPACHLQQSPLGLGYCLKVKWETHLQNKIPLRTVMLVLEMHLYFSCHHHPAKCKPFSRLILPLCGCFPQEDEETAGRSARPRARSPSAPCTPWMVRHNPTALPRNGNEGGTWTSLPVDIQQASFPPLQGKLSLLTDEAAFWSQHRWVSQKCS